MPAISIVVPVYNAEAHLEACLDSLLGQTFADIEVVCVDDGSKDASPALLDARAAQDERLHVLHQENAGVSQARNAGLAVAQGEVVMFCDADDWYVEGACERVWEVFCSESADVVVFGAACVPEEGVSPQVLKLLSPRDAVYEPFSPELLYKENASPYAVRVAVRRDLLERAGIGFTPGLAVAEDAVFCFELYPCSEKTVLIPDKLYRYRMGESSATSSYNAAGARERKLEQHLRAIEAILAGWRGRGHVDADPGAFIGWCMDLVLFDLSAMPDGVQREVCARLAGMLASAYGEGFSRLPATASARAAARRIERGAGFSGTAGKACVALFFAGRRGLSQCLAKVLRRG